MRQATYPENVMLSTRPITDVFAYFVMTLIYTAKNPLPASVSWLEYKKSTLVTLWST